MADNLCWSQKTPSQSFKRLSMVIGALQFFEGCVVSTSLSSACVCTFGQKYRLCCCLSMFFFFIIYFISVAAKIKKVEFSIQANSRCYFLFVKASLLNSIIIAGLPKIKIYLWWRTFILYKINECKKSIIKLKIIINISYISLIFFSENAQLTYHELEKLEVKMRQKCTLKE